MTRRPRTNLDASLVAIVIPRDGEFDTALWRRTAEGPRLERMSPTAASALASTLEAGSAGRTIVMLAPGQARCRIFELPKAPEPQLEQALRLQAESVQLGSVPPHRVGFSLLPANGAANRSGAVIEWPLGEAAPSLPAAAAARRLTYAGDVTSLVG
ncbi:MAG: hypothetical protein FJ253_12695, partial [Phycisphaerae bacterium]|nr:hypothetical protein [Phycisphaerae bacterium]